MINRHEIDCLVNYYFGNSQLKEIDYNELKQMNKQKNIKRIYGVYENFEYDAWYLICPKKGRARILPKMVDNILASDIINDFRKGKEFIHIRPDILRKYARGIFPIMCKNEPIKSRRKPNFEKYLNENGYPLCYSEYCGEYLVFSKGNGLSMMTRVKTEEEAILTLITASEYTGDVNFNDLFSYVVDNRNHILDLNGELKL